MGKIDVDGSVQTVNYVWLGCVHCGFSRNNGTGVSSSAVFCLGKKLWRRGLLLEKEEFPVIQRGHGMSDEIALTTRSGEAVPAVMVDSSVYCECEATTDDAGKSRYYHGRSKSSLLPATALFCLLDFFVFSLLRFRRL